MKMAMLGMKMKKLVVPNEEVDMPQQEINTEDEFTDEETTKNYITNGSKRRRLDYLLEPTICRWRRLNS